MSYEIIKSISIEEDKVFVIGASNNVRPLYFNRWECTPLSNTLKEKGKDLVEIEILEAYESGEFQGGTNKFTKALKVLNSVLLEEYKKFDWRNHNAKYGTPEHQKERDSRKSQEFKDLLKKALDYKLPKEKYVIFKDGFFGKITSKGVIWHSNKSKATKFEFSELAEKEKRNFPESVTKGWEIVQLETTQ